MEIKALSHYDGDKDTRFGDCILIFNNSSLIVYDCGHTKHAEYVRSFLQTKPTITSVHVVVSHNDSDHTNGVCELLEYLSLSNKHTVKVYTHQYLKYVDTIINKIDDGRRNRESLKRALLEEFDNIKKIIEKAQELDYPTVEALKGVDVGYCTIVGPTVGEFTDVAAKAVDNREKNTIGEDYAEETVMNAASVQMKCILDNGDSVLLCGDASPDYLKNIAAYDIIQLPHHGQEDNARAIFGKLDGDAFCKAYLISDNTGSAKNSGGSDDTVKYMEKEKYTSAYNTRDGIVDLPVPSSARRRVFLGDLDSI